MGFAQDDFQRFGGKQIGHAAETSQLIDAIAPKKTCHSKTKPSAAAEG
jgi:hypothetical protein